MAIPRRDGRTKTSRSQGPFRSAGDSDIQSQGESEFDDSGLNATARRRSNKQVAGNTDAQLHTSCSGAFSRRSLLAESRRRVRCELRESGQFPFSFPYPFLWDLRETRETTNRRLVPAERVRLFSNRSMELLERAKDQIGIRTGQEWDRKGICNPSVNIGDEYV